MYCLSSVTGEKKWWQPQGVHYLAATAKNVYATDRDDNLLILSRETGNVTGNLSLRRFSVRFANDRTDRVIVATESGLVMVLREKGRMMPTFHMYPDRLPLVPDFASEEGDGPADEMPGEGEMEGEAEMEAEPTEEQ